MKTIIILILIFLVIILCVIFNKEIIKILNHVDFKKIISYLATKNKKQKGVRIRKAKIDNSEINDIRGNMEISNIKIKDSKINNIKG